MRSTTLHPMASAIIQNCTTNWPLALVAVVTVIATSVWGKGIIKIIPKTLGDGYFCSS